MREKQTAIVVSAALLIAAFIFGRFLPLRQQLASASAGIEMREKAIATAAAQSQRLEEARIEMMELEARVGDFEKRVPGDRSLGDFLQEIAHVMSELGLEEQVVAPGAELETDLVNCIPVSMKCKGRLDEIFRFFEALRGMERLMRIEQVKLTGSNEMDGIVSMETQAVIFFRGLDDGDEMGGGQKI